MRLSYQVAMPQPTNHLFEVTICVEDWGGDRLDLKMPVWTPGSYMVREYSRHLQDFTAQTPEGKPLPWQKLAKNHWQIDSHGVTSLTLTYRIFAHDLTVRTNHLDRTHGYFNGAAIFCYVPGFEDQACDVAIVPPEGWQVTTALPQSKPNQFTATSFDQLVDSPFEIGQHQIFPFEVLGKPHQYAIWGQGNYNPATLIQDSQKIIEVEAELFGGLPYDRYLFLLHLTPNGFGGLEHRDSCSLIFDRLSFNKREKYEDLLQLVAHEFFHLWNIKRLRPKALETFDYNQENYTPSLWFSEGTTSYYDLAIPFRAGIYNAKTYLKNLSKEITRFLTTPGRKIQPLSESSFDAWIKLYRPDNNTPNSQMSYYLKGEMVTMLLDLAIRIKHNNTKSFDQVLQTMWQRFGQREIGFLPEELEEVIQSIAGFDLQPFFKRYLHGLEDLPFDEYLSAFGLRLENNVQEAIPYTGLTFKTSHGRTLIKSVASDSPAQQAGICPGDELVALEGLRLEASQWGDRLQDYPPGSDLHLTLFHADTLYTCTVMVLPPQATSWTIAAIEDPTPLQEQNCQAWLGEALKNLA
jgi:predicted metalloprotease with PDZ domain